MNDVLEVISINRITDAATGDLIYQIQFGKLIDIDESNRPMMPLPAGPIPIKKQMAIVLALNVGFSGTVPYLVGSKWRIAIDKVGNISLKEVKD
jgi:hypothetical protein